MSRDFPDWIDPARAAQGGREFSGNVPLAWMERLKGMLDAPGPEEEIGFRLAVRRDEQNAVALELKLKGQVPLTCQRTLERFWFQVDTDSTLIVVDSEAALEGLSEDAEPKLCESGRLNVVELVEDELLLALPIVPFAPDSEPVVDAGVAPASMKSDEAEPAEENPFAVLKKLHKDS